MTRALHVLILAAMSLITVSGCTQATRGERSYGPQGPAQSARPQRFEVLAPARQVNAEEAVNFIRAQNELDQTRASNGGTDHLDGPTNHPAFNGGAHYLTALTIREQESLLSVANRVMSMANYSRLIYDLSDVAPSPDTVQAAARVSTMGGPTLFGEIAATYVDQIPNLQVFTALDGQGQALVISDKGYPRWELLAIHDVRPGTLQQNVAELARGLGWTLAEQNGWNADDFNIYTGYPIVIAPENPRQAIISLLHRYPVQAQLNQNTRTMAVVPRAQP